MRKKHKSRRPLVESVFGEVESLRSEGYVLEDVVVKVIAERGLDITYRTFLYHYYRIRKDQKAIENSQASAPIDLVKAPLTPSKTTEMADKVKALFESKRNKK